MVYHKEYATTPEISSLERHFFNVDEIKQMFGCAKSNLEERPGVEFRFVEWAIFLQNENQLFKMKRPFPQQISSYTNVRAFEGLDFGKIIRCDFGQFVNLIDKLAMILYVVL